MCALATPPRLASPSLYGRPFIPGYCHLTIPRSSGTHVAQFPASETPVLPSFNLHAQFACGALYHCCPSIGRVVRCSCLLSRPRCRGWPNQFIVICVVETHNSLLTRFTLNPDTKRMQHTTYMPKLRHMIAERECTHRCIVSQNFRLRSIVVF
jgi:hypothetical protein